MRDERRFGVDCQLDVRVGVIVVEVIACLYEAVYNGAGLWADGSELLTINRSTFSNNKASGVAPSIYVYGTKAVTNVLVSNCVLNGNSISPDPGTRAGGGIYVRENGNVVVINTTIYGNSSGKGGGISCYGSKTLSSTTNIISCTISGNTISNSTSGGGLFQNNAYAVVNVYNTLIAGNLANGAADDAVFSKSNYKYENCIFGSTVYDAAGNAVAGTAFDFTTMLGAFGDNGGTTRSCLLTGDGNPARAYGMSASDLEILGTGLNPQVPTSISNTDQNGNSRAGLTVIGAMVK